MVASASSTTDAETLSRGTQRSVPANAKLKQAYDSILTEPVLLVWVGSDRRQCPSLCRVHVYVLE